jgi:hypothetical protein
MLTAGAVCPHPPLLVPVTTGGQAGPGDAELARLRRACDAAVTALIDAQPDVIVVVGSKDGSAAGAAQHVAADTDRYPPDAAGSLRDYGVPITIGVGLPVLPLSLTVARWLLTRAGIEPTALHAVAAATSPARCRELGRQFAGLAPHVALLAMGDGPARRACSAPGAVDPAADRYDQRVTRALAKADVRGLATLDPAHDKELLVAGRAAWQVLAGAADGRGYAATLHYAAVPFEVSYYVATWRLN